MSILPYKYSEQAISFDVLFQALIAEKVTTRWLKRFDYVRESKIIKKGHAYIIDRKIVEIFHAELCLLKRFFQFRCGNFILTIFFDSFPQLYPHCAFDQFNERVQRCDFENISGFEQGAGFEIDDSVFGQGVRVTANAALKKRNVQDVVGVVIDLVCYFIQPE